MKNKTTVKIGVYIGILSMIWQCDDNNVGSTNNCGIETTFIQELDNIDSLGNASSSDLKLMDDFHSPPSSF